jgi:nucleotide-binding universal stress UspA family protein
VAAAALADSFHELNDRVKEDGRQFLSGLVKGVKARGFKKVHGTVISSPAVKEGIVDFVNKNNGEDEDVMVFVGTRGLGAIKRAFLGSFSSYILHHTHLDVVIVRHGTPKSGTDHEYETHDHAEAA